MNIVIIGPGNDPKRFGTYFVNKAEEQEHKVVKFSYRLTAESPEEISDRFEKTIESLEQIDLLLYNSIGGFYPGDPSQYTSTHDVKFTDWQTGILINAALPHMFSVKCLAKMNNRSAIVFLTSSASYLINRDNFLQMAGYFGTKGAMNQLMRALAEYNDKNAIVCTFAPHIPYDQPDMAEKIMDKLTKYILRIHKDDTGKILQCYPPEGNMFYHTGGVDP